MFLILVLIISVSFFNCKEMYNTKYDHLDVNLIIKNDRLLKNYVDCILEKGKCTPVGQEIKNKIPDALEDGCAKCSETQILAFKKIIQHLLKNRPNWLEDLLKKFDPSGQYKKRYKLFFSIVN
ncbi:unnamed protein product [Brassicogethes aeneus]|uniref:Uncharacterized protein n=1 Tax=Brassicogethes aeneus TaxID=1431903 RepID=A0A9P0AUZ7_BRAAE|nr:unnamed protein product [Brassicogethes aeneus]